jgi:soluble lytic murein transglycosylase-like protein
LGKGGVDYLGEHNEAGATRRAAKLYGHLWPRLSTVAFLHETGQFEQAQRELRHIALEFRGLNGRFKKGARIVNNRPIALSHRRWAHFIDHRGAATRGFWGLRPSDFRYPVPKNHLKKRELAARQKAIFDVREQLEDDLRLAMMEVGDYHLVRLMRLEHGRWWRSAPSADNAVAWSQAYPRAFPQWVQKYAAIEGLNPYLLWALMTVESAYNPDSVSYADARGLLQVIPKTGNKVAQGVGDLDFGPYDLLGPETSVRHGAWYFARLVKKFHGQEPLAIASYNGGPHNVARWLKHKTHIPLDEFVEEIPFDQARGYTKKVLRFLALFRRLYEGRDDLYVGQVLTQETLVEPRY